MISEYINSFLPVSLNSFRIDTIGSFDIFIKSHKNKKEFMILYHSGGDRFTGEVRNKLIANKIEQVYIRATDKELYHQYIEENLQDYLKDPHIPTGKKAEFAHLSISNIAQSLFDNPQASTISRYKKTISTTMDFVLDEEEALKNMIRLTSYDFTTYTHSVNVGIFAIGLAKVLFVDDPEHNMKEIASGFFLHDIGKCDIPLSILTKPGPLTENEWSIMKNHPQKGYEILMKFNKLTPEAKVIVLEHHERQSGNGYPKGISGDKIHIYSKVCCIADVFDALTAKRPYKRAHSCFEALKVMKEEMFQEFDPYFFNQFVILFSNQAIKSA
ncbi:MAG: HD domain-containing protein [Candidatus Latescibacteria bacterium]|nr:HD domain-containing protein [Candidatus Latescibacterota bacterium]